MRSSNGSKTSPLACAKETERAIERTCGVQRTFICERSTRSRRLTQSAPARIRRQSGAAESSLIVDSDPSGIWVANAPDDVQTDDRGAAASSLIVDSDPSGSWLANAPDEVQTDHSLKRSAPSVLSPFQVHIEKMPKDGSCLFHAIAYGLAECGVFLSGSQIRQSVATFIAFNADFEVAGDSLRDWVAIDSQTSVSEYATRLRSVYQWGGEIEIKVSCHIHSVDIAVYQKTDDGEIFLRTNYYPTADAAPRGVVKLLYVGGNHYDAIDDTCHQSNANEITSATDSDESVIEAQPTSAPTEPTLLPTEPPTAPPIAPRIAPPRTPPTEVGFNSEDDDTYFERRDRQAVEFAPPPPPPHGIEERKRRQVGDLLGILKLPCKNTLCLVTTESTGEQHPRCVCRVIDVKGDRMTLVHAREDGGSRLQVEMSTTDDRIVQEKTNKYCPHFRKVCSYTWKGEVKECPQVNRDGEKAKEHNKNFCHDPACIMRARDQEHRRRMPGVSRLPLSSRNHSVLSPRSCFGRVQNIHNDGAATSGSSSSGFWNRPATQEDDAHWQRAVRNYESFHELPAGTATLDQVVFTSAGWDGWASANICREDDTKMLVDGASHALAEQVVDNSCRGRVQNIHNDGAATSGSSSSGFWNRPATQDIHNDGAATSGLI